MCKLNVLLWNSFQSCEEGKKNMYRIKWRYALFVSQNFFFWGAFFPKLPFINLWVIWGKCNLRTNRIGLFFYEIRQKIKIKEVKKKGLQRLEYAIRMYVYQNTVWNRNCLLKDYTVMNRKFLLFYLPDW